MRITVEVVDMYRPVHLATLSSSTGGLDMDLVVLQSQRECPILADERHSPRAVGRIGTAAQCNFHVPQKGQRLVAMK